METMKKQPQKKKYKAIALTTRKCYQGGVEYDFKKGEEYEIANKEHFDKLTNPLNGTLKGV